MNKRRRYIAKRRRTTARRLRRTSDILRSLWVNEVAAAVNAVIPTRIQGPVHITASFFEGKVPQAEK